MRRRVPGFLAVAGLALASGLGAPPALGQGGGAMLAPVTSETFPQRAFRLSTPENRALRADQVDVRENGDPVGQFQVIPAASGANSFGTVLVIDASSSMRGRAIEAAVEAGRELARQRSGSQQFGIVVFNRRARILLDLTDEQAAIDEALSTTPRLAPQTHVYDGVGTALDLIATAGLAAGTVVVLSDGADTGSTASARSIGRRARKDDVRIFSIGLRSGAFDPGGLRSLASAAAQGGAYASAESVEDLSPIFRQIGAQLANEYLVRYRSNVGPGRDVRVAVRVEGVPGLATAAYRVPGDATFVLVEKTFWTSTLGVVTTTLLCSLLLAVALGIVLIRRLRPKNVRQRIGAFVRGDQPVDDDAPTRDEVLTGRLLESTERSLERTQWWSSFKQDVDIAGIEISAVRIVAVTAGTTLLLAWIVGSLAGTFLPVPFVAIIPPLVVRAIVRARVRRQRQRFADQLPDMLQGVASALRAGHGLVGALSMVVEDAQEPSLTEFSRVVADERLGVPLDEALDRMRKRMDSRDVQQLALVAQLQRETGGNIAEVLDRVTATVRQRAELRRMVRGLTAQGRLSRAVVSALPVALLAVMSLLSPAYVAPLFTTTVGVGLLMFGAFIITMGSLVIKKIVDFDV